MSTKKGLSEDTIASLFYVGFIVVALTVASCVWITKSYFEMKAYNRLAGSDVTLIEAMFTNLRVDCNKQ